MGIDLGSELSLGLGSGLVLRLGSVQYIISIEIAVTRKKQKMSVFWSSVFKNSPHLFFLLYRFRPDSVTQLVGVTVMFHQC